MTCPYCEQETTFCERTDPDEENNYKLIYACNTEGCRCDFIYFYMKGD
jgi:hypothetical protein